MSIFKDLTGEKFGRLTVIKLDKKIQSGNRKRYYWLCKCGCGNYTSVRTDCLTKGQVKSCGCLKREQDRANLEANHSHKLSHTKLWNTYYGMKRRCYNPKDKRYKNYGARGIKICSEWLNDFNKFVEWSYNNGYNDNLSIDRINNDGNYEPCNCRWATPKQQSNNRRSNIRVNCKGKSITLKELSENIGISYQCIDARYNNGDRGKRLIRKINTDKKVVRGSKQHLSKLSEREVKEIKRLLEKGELQVAIAQKYNVSKGAINSIYKNRTWKHVK
ncbi:hypothetical protein [Clostridium tyrobutyricum]|uniref:hypothetical protein n=1 Tax=Clostridium tyrobutyricum TaxID=1519 RepID=UPI001C38DE0F|nr:hypothetical protein [Clostridium tyrobutyricum]MBV4423238.1 hypothetical protein [Clostridium tyrobutyricum]